MEVRNAIIAENVTKVYKMYTNKRDPLKELLTGKSGAKEFYALKGVTFSLEEGESLGLVGLNGSGKSTLADIIGGISVPTAGSIVLNGEPSIISVSSGMNPQLTGRSNIIYKGLLIGLEMKQINELMPKIIEFADIGEFIDQPIKVYSSGMKARLGFAISINISPDILVIDEALSVGDPSFMQKCLDRMNQFREDNKTVVFVSHNPRQIRNFCSKVLWLEYGILKAFGDTGEVLPMYERFIETYNKMSNDEKQEYISNVIENQGHMLISENK